MRKDIWDRFLLKIYYEERFDLGTDYDVPFEFLYEDELELIYNSFGFSIFKLKYKVFIFIKKIIKKIKTIKKQEKTRKNEN